MILVTFAISLRQQVARQSVGGPYTSLGLLQDMAYGPNSMDGLVLKDSEGLRVPAWRLLRVVSA